MHANMPDVDIKSRKFPGNFLFIMLMVKINSKMKRMEISELSFYLRKVAQTLRETYIRKGQADLDLLYGR